MTPQQQIISALKFQKTDKVPLWIHVDGELVPIIDRYYGTTEWRKKIIGSHICALGCAWPNGAPGETVRDPFGSLIRLGNIPHMVEPALKNPSLKGYRWPDPEELVDVAAFQRATESNADKFRQLEVSFGFLERAIYMRGMEDFLVDMVEHPDFVEEFNEQYLRLKTSIHTMLSEVADFEGVHSGGDDCDGRGCMMGVNRWRALIKPYLQKEIDHVHSLGKYYLYHCCGNVMPLIDDLLEMGIDALDPLQPECMDILALKPKLNGKVAMMGGMGSQVMLPFGTPDEIRARTRQLIEVLGEDGGYVLGNCKPMYLDTSAENAVAFIEEAMQGEPLF